MIQAISIAAGSEEGAAPRNILLPETYDLVWSGEIDSCRLGRKLLVSRASVDAYIESRSGRK